MRLRKSQRKGGCKEYLDEKSSTTVVEDISDASEVLLDVVRDASLQNE